MDTENDKTAKYYKFFKYLVCLNRLAFEVLSVDGVFIVELKQCKASPPLSTHYLRLWVTVTMMEFLALFN